MRETYTDDEGVEHCDACAEPIEDCVCTCPNCGDALDDCACDEEGS